MGGAGNITVKWQNTIDKEKILNATRVKMTRVPSKHSKVQKQTTGMSQVVASHADVQGRWGHWCGQEVFSILCVVPVGKVVVSGRLQKTNLPEQRQTEEVKMPEA